MPAGSAKTAREGDDWKRPGSSDIPAKAADAAESLKDQATDMAQRGVQKIDETLEASAETMDSAASTIRRGADVLPDSTTAKRLAGQAADALESGADYLHSHDAESMVQDARRFVKNHPAGSLAVAAVAGFLAGRALWRD